MMKVKATTYLGRKTMLMICELVCKVPVSSLKVIF